jgi:Rod binding domain-containing protein
MISAINPIQSHNATAANTPSAQELDARKAFDSFVGETFFGQMLASMRKMTSPAPYFHGGQAEKTFQAQLDQMLSQEMAKASASSFTGPMYELFMLNRS